MRRLILPPRGGIKNILVKVMQPERYRAHEMNVDLSYRGAELETESKQSRKRRFGARSNAVPLKSL